MTRAARLTSLARQTASAEALVGALGTQLLNLKAVLSEMKKVLADIAAEIADDPDETTPQ